jgi:hypothetical protein
MVPSSSRVQVVHRPKINVLRRAALNREVDLQPREKHQKQLAQFAKKICDWPIRAKKMQPVWSDRNAANQQVD